MSVENYSFLKQLILEEILDNKPSYVLSRDLCFNFDKYKRWIQHSKILKWNEFEFICKHVGLNLKGALETINFISLDKEEGPSLMAHLKKYNNFSTNLELADFLKCHVSVVKRHVRGLISPQVEIVLKLINLRPGQLLLFLSALFNQEKHRAFLEKISNNLNSTGLTLEMQIISAAIDLEDHIISPMSTVDWLKQNTKINADVIKSLMDSMIKASMIQSNDGKKFYNNHKVIYQNESIGQGMLSLLNFIPSHTGTHNNGILRIFNTGEETRSKIKNIIYNANNEIEKILNSSDHINVEVTVVVMQVLPLTLTK